MYSKRKTKRETFVYNTHMKTRKKNERKRENRPRDNTQKRQASSYGSVFSGFKIITVNEVDVKEEK